MKPNSSRAIAVTTCCLFLPLPKKHPVAIVQTVLRLPGDGLHLFAQTLLALAQGGPFRRPVAVGPGRLDHDSPQVGVAGLRDRAATHLLPARVLARYHAAVAHELIRPLEARDLPELGSDGHR